MSKLGKKKNEKLKRLIPLIIIAQPTTSLEGVAEYRRVKRKLEKLEKENFFKFDKILEDLGIQIKKHLQELGLVVA